MEVAGNSVIGMRRENNEDAIFIDTEEQLYIVADGMGGCSAGEVASNTAVEAFAAIMKGQKDTEILDRMIDAVVAANHMVYEKSHENISFADMGTTLVAAMVVDKRIFVVHVGDSRAYLFRKNQLRQLTTDHSYVMELVKSGSITREEAAVHPKRNVITRAIGIREDVEADTIIEEWQEGDKLLLCTDGLSNMVSEGEIVKILVSERTTAEKVQILTEIANQNGGLDNISLILTE